jgi:hypothetical protein
MIDTQPYIYKIQYDIIASKPMAERTALGFETIDSIRQMVKNSILSIQPEIDDASLEMQIFLRYYANDFKPDVLNKIAQSIYDYHRNKEILNI